MTEGPVQVNMYGIRYFINGDLSDPYVKKLMVQARNDLQGMKDRNINDIDHIWMNKPKAYKIDSQFGIDSVYIDVPFGREEHRKIEWQEKKERKDIEGGLYPAFEIFDSTKTKIGYAICLSGTFAPPYYLLITDNVIDAYASKDEVAVIREVNPGIVDPFIFPMWKYEYGSDYGRQEFRPFDEPVLPNRLIKIESIGNELSTYTDIACTFEELVILADWYDQELIKDVDFEESLYWLPTYSGDTSGASGNDMWKCGGVWAQQVVYDTLWSYLTPSEGLLVTMPDWFVNDDYDNYDELSEIESTLFVRDTDLIDGNGAYVFNVDGDITTYIPCPRTSAYGSDCRQWAGGWYDDEPYWAWSNDPNKTQIAYGGWCHSQGCWDQTLAYAQSYYDGCARVTEDDIGYPPHSSTWKYYCLTTTIDLYYDTNYGAWSNAKDINHYVFFVHYTNYTYNRTQEMVETYDPRNEYYEQWNGCSFPAGEVGCYFGNHRLPEGEVKDDVWEYIYEHKYYIEVNGPDGLEEKIIHESNEYDSGLSIDGVNLRYYQLSEGTYWVLGTIILDDDAEEDRQVLHIVYRSGQGFLEDLVLPYEATFGGGDVFSLYEIDGSLRAPNGGPVLADGSFRLIQVTKETKYPDEIKNYEQQLY